MSLLYITFLQAHPYLIFFIFTNKALIQNALDLETVTTKP